MSLTIHKIFLFFLIIGLVSCNNTSTTETTTSTETNKVQDKPLLPTPSFNQDSAYHYIEEQVAFGARYPNSEAHQKTGDYIINKLKSFDKISVQVQNFTAASFDGKMLSGRNIIASFNPEIKRRVLLAAHWDTRPFADQDEERTDEPILGANDGGSGTGILLEIARTLSVSQEQPQVGIDMIFFDLEDYGDNNTPNSYCLGSQHWGKNKMPANYSAYYGILLDMAGAKNAQFAQEGYSLQTAPAIVSKVWKMAHKIGHGAYFPFKEAPAITDDHVYVNQLTNIPMIDIIEYSTEGKGYFGKYWHTHDDNMDIIGKETLKAVGQTVTHVIYNEEYQGQ
ncbi:M28 family peptidase [Bernardetia sp.]|uniref:M28 family peptidase n=1 Tax=Bernardetia sp. TaxID=1937974 RepID=UPI0025BB9B08|nr:M28 family peptidase [Bernardetia sp.]